MFGDAGGLERVLGGIKYGVPGIMRARYRKGAVGGLLQETSGTAAVEQGGIIDFM